MRVSSSSLRTSLLLLSLLLCLPVWGQIKWVSQDTTHQTAGTSGTRYRPSGVIYVNTTQAATTAVTTEETLWTWPLPAGVLAKNGDVLTIKVMGTFAANANTKTCQLYFNGTALLTSFTGTFNNRGFTATATITRTSATSQLAEGAFGVTDTSARFGTITAPTGDTAGAITIAFKGTNGTANANDIVFRGAIVTVAPSPD